MRSPTWRNELINRRSLSASAAARRDLIVAMIEHPTGENLGMKGVPPERSICEMLLRLFRSPERFERQRFRIAGPRLDVFKRYAAFFNHPDAAAEDSPDLLALVKPLVRKVKELPEYVTKTKQTSPAAQAVLKAIREARQPGRLLFAELPSACGFDAFPASGAVKVAEVGKYFDVLRSALAELQRTYPQLLANIERAILDALGQYSPLDKARKRLNHPARRVLNPAIDARLKSFVSRVIDDTDNNTWLESIATLLCGKPPAVWGDQDQAKFEVQLSSTARTFNHFWALAFEMEKKGVTLPDGERFATSAATT